jgi:hypothetical protein
MKVAGPPLNWFTGAATQVPAPGFEEGDDDGVGLALGVGLLLGELLVVGVGLTEVGLGVAEGELTEPLHTVPFKVNCAGTVFVPEYEPLKPKESAALVPTEPL